MGQNLKYRRLLRRETLDCKRWADVESWTLNDGANSGFELIRLPLYSHASKDIIRASIDFAPPLPFSACGIPVDDMVYFSVRSGTQNSSSEATSRR